LKLSKAILHTVFPLPLVSGSISPDHFALAMSMIPLELAIISPSSAPYYGSKALFAIILKATSIDGRPHHKLIGTFINNFVLHNPLPSSMLLAFAELPRVGRAIRPNVLASAIELAFSEVANIVISIAVLLSSITMFQ